MGGGKGGGSSSSKAMVDYGNKALALQEGVYKDLKAANAPYLAGGQAGLSELLMRMGLSGSAATAPSNRQSLIEQYTPQFTTTTNTGSGNLYIGPDNRIYDLTDKAKFLSDYSKNAPKDGNTAFRVSMVLNKGLDLKNYGFTPMGQSSTTTDTAGLNSYVDKLMATQAATDQANPLYGSLLKSFSMEDYQADPGYQFRLSEGNKALERALASRGMYASMNPAAAKALQDYGQQSASQEYGSAYDRYNINQGNIYNRLANIAGIGQTAVGTQAGVGQNYANAGTDILTSQGNAITAAKQASAANRGSMFNTLLGAGLAIGAAPTTGGGSLFGSWFSDKRLKTDIKEYDVKNGHKRYVYRYADNPEKQYIGVLAQEVMEIDPMAVTMDEESGYYKVNYDKLGFTLEVLPCL